MLVPEVWERWRAADFVPLAASDDVSAGLSKPMTMRKFPQETTSRFFLTVHGVLALLLDPVQLLSWMKRSRPLIPIRTSATS
mmetsp:Transcript_55874/g.148890  ORF Transcript_55874/g.148890 Transcript_55874/m.148890 type:complete len:82 (+) Transcript_55874:1080-1325(+)